MASYAGYSFIQGCRKVVAVGRNWAAHAKELGNAVPTTPFFFLKPPSSFLAEGKGPIEIPRGAKEIHHEVELGVVIGRAGRDIPAARVNEYIAGYCLALDMTDRQAQEIAKKKSLPWSAAKGADTFMPLSTFIEKSAIPDLNNVELWLRVNGLERQRGSTRDMIFNVPTLISYISSITALEPGDLILTGTPDGVGPVVAGDTIEAGITGVVSTRWQVANRAPASKL